MADEGPTPAAVKAAMEMLYSVLGVRPVSRNASRSGDTLISSFPPPRAGLTVTVYPRMIPLRFSAGMVAHERLMTVGSTGSRSAVKLPGAAPGAKRRTEWPH